MAEPVGMTVDSVFALLDEALDLAIKAGGEKAKSVAWDVHSHFASKIGHLRSGATAKQEAS